MNEDWEALILGDSGCVSPVEQLKAAQCTTCCFFYKGRIPPPFPTGARYMSYCINNKAVPTAAKHFLTQLRLHNYLTLNDRCCQMEILQVSKCTSSTRSFINHFLFNSSVEVIIRETLHAAIISILTFYFCVTNSILSV